MLSKPLTNVSLIVTRPEPMGSTLCAKFRELGANTYNYPTLAIEFAELGHKENLWLENPGSFSRVIWISRHAVAGSAPKMAFAKLKSSAKLLTVGEGTKQALQHFTSHEVIAPAQADSEGLLALPELQHVADNNILLIKGQGGRPLLEQSLQNLGAKVAVLDCYRRVLISDGPEGLLSWWPGTLVKPWVIITSGESLQHFYQQLAASADPQAKQLLAASYFVLASKRIAELALNLGVIDQQAMAERVIIAQGACDQHLINAIMQFYADKDPFS